MGIMLPWQPAIVCCVMFDAMLLSDLANKFSLSLKANYYGKFGGEGWNNWS